MIVLFIQLTTVNGVPVQFRALYATNGVVYVIEKVLVPQTERSIAGVLVSDARFSTLVTAAKIAGLVETLDSGKFNF